MFLKAFYYFCYGLIKFVSFFFFEKRTIYGSEYFDLQRPTIVVSNHPNTLLDPILIATEVSKQMYFLGNAGLFANRFSNWLFRTFYCIPIKRKQDTVTNVNNNDSFEQCDVFLAKGGCLYIAPEGSSWQERHLREIKTGTARIALSVEAKNNFQLGLKIQPIGITYTYSGVFGTRFFIKGIEPVLISDYKKLYEEDSECAVDAITEAITKQLKKAMIDTEDLEQDLLLERCETLLLGKKQYENNAGFEYSQELSERLKKLKQKNKSDYDGFLNVVNQYFIHLKNSKINDFALTQKNNYLLLLLGLPFFLSGFSQNIIPFCVVYFIWKKATPLGYDATVQFLGGLIFFTTFYTLQKNILVDYLPKIPLYGLVYWATALASGWFAWRYFIHAKYFFQSVFCTNKNILLSERDSILRLLEKI
jgi:glycerol-3-phosphate O-acyltransferase / dihydroxyacetone phosphate acyltransferase